MPAYGSQVYIDLVDSDQPLWVGEQPAPGNGLLSASFPVKLPRTTQSFYVIGAFRANPGVFEIDVQGAAEDFDTQYATLQNGLINVCDPVNFTFRTDFVNFLGGYLRALMRSRANAALVDLKIVRGCQ